MPVLQEILTLFLWRNSLLNTLNYQISLPEMSVEYNFSHLHWFLLISPTWNLGPPQTSILFSSIVFIIFLFSILPHIYIYIYNHPSIHPFSSVVFLFYTLLSIAILAPLVITSSSTALKYHLHAGDCHTYTFSPDFSPQPHLPVSRPLLWMFTRHLKFNMPQILDFHPTPPLLHALIQPSTSK